MPGAWVVVFGGVWWLCFVVLEREGQAVQSTDRTRRVREYDKYDIYDCQRTGLGGLESASRSSSRLRSASHLLQEVM